MLIMVPMNRLVCRNGSAGAPPGNSPPALAASGSKAGVRAAAVKTPPLSSAARRK